MAHYVYRGSPEQAEHAFVLQGQGRGVQIPADDRPTLLCASHFGPEGMLRLKGSRLARSTDAPIPSLFWAAGFSFSRSQLLTEVRHFTILLPVRLKTTL